MGVRRRTKTSQLLVALGVVSAIVIMMSTSAWASHAHLEISIPVDTVVEAEEGSTTQLGTAQVPPDFADHVCEVRAHAENQRSIHPGNDIVVSSGNSQVLLPDVEAEPGQVIDTDDMLELGEVITVSLLMGPDEVFSAGIEVIVECFEEETTTTAEVLPTEVTTSTTTEQSTTTTAQVAPTESPSTTADAEVLQEEVLPDTGLGEPQLGLLALALLASGALMVVAIRSTGD